jgi:hypothetical protein
VFWVKLQLIDNASLVYIKENAFIGDLDLEVCTGRVNSLTTDGDFSG